MAQSAGTKMRCVLVCVLGMSIGTVPVRVRAQESALAATVGPWCSQKSAYQRVLEEKIANLRWSLFALSQMGLQEALLKGLAESATISLANLLSLRAQYLTRCEIPKEEYFRLMSQNETFSENLLEVLIAEQSWARTSVANKYKQFQLIGSPAEVIRHGEKETGGKLPLAPAITQRLTLVRSQINNDASNPFCVAAHRLSGGGPGKLGEREVKIVPVIPVDGKNPFATATGDDAAKLIEQEKTEKLLFQLSTYYTKVPKHPLIPQIFLSK